MQMLDDTSAEDDFWKYCDKRRNCSLSQCFQPYSIVTLRRFFTCLPKDPIMFSKLFAAVLLDVEKVKIPYQPHRQVNRVWNPTSLIWSHERKLASMTTPSHLNHFLPTQEGSSMVWKWYQSFVFGEKPWRKGKMSQEWTL